MKNILKKYQPGFSLLEILVVIAIIAVLTTISLIVFSGARAKAGDAKRMNDLNQVGRFLSFGCLTPDRGTGEYDLNELIEEFKVKYPQYEKYIPSNLRDPKTGTDIVSNYKYMVDENEKCVLYANLENEEAAVSLPTISAPTPGGGNGVFKAAAVGPNGSRKYFQISN